MKAHLHFARIAPKKANLIALMVRGMTVPAATEALRLTHKKGAKLIATLLRSAVANASHNDKQDPQTMIIKKLVVNQGTAYRRGMPKARGQMRPYRKFLSHIDLELGFATDATPTTPKNPTNPKKASSQKAETPVKKTSTKSTPKTSAKKDSDESSISKPQS